MKIILVTIVCIFQFLLMTQTAIASQPDRIALLKEMFAKVAVEKNAKAIPLYYDKDFELYSNGKKSNYNEYLQLNQNIFKTAIQYNVRYDEKTFVAHENKVAGRVFIITKMPNEPAREIELILIAEYKDTKLYRLWELTYPEWSKVITFKRNT